MNVLSLFDGMSCGQQALERAGVIVDNYYASEIDKYAIQVTMANYPNTIQLGSVVNVDGYSLPKIDLLIGGSPCQSFSFAGKRKGMSTKCETEILTLEHYLELKADGYEFEGQSYLFWEFMRLLNECKPTYFLLENVEMGEKWEKVLSKAIGVNGIHINSALVSAQNRKRIYWTNIGLEPGGLFGDLVSTIQQPKDKGILLKDVLESDVDEKYYLSDKMIACLQGYEKFNKYTTETVDSENKSSCISARIHKMGNADTYIKIDKQGNVKDNQDKASCFTAGGNPGGNHSDMDLIVQCAAMRGRNPENPKSRTPGLETEQQLEMRNDNKTNCLTSVQKDNLVIQLNPSKESGGKQPYQQNRIYDTEGISPDLCANKSDLLLSLPCDYRSDEGIRIRENGKSPTLTRGAETSGTQYNSLVLQIMGDKSNTVTQDGYLATGKRNRDENGKAILTSMHERRIRRLTPLECERLQTVVDGYTNHVSDTQRYRMLGNGWTVSVVSHIFSYLPKEFKI